MDTSPNTTVSVDGSQGEGGGQVVRTALTLGATLGVPVHITSVRAGRRKPGLLRQHLTCARAVAELTGVECAAELGDTELAFAPGPVRAGSYRFAVGSAGSTALVVQTVLLPLLFADGSSEVVVEGGTHALAAPPFEALALSFVPALRAMGADVSLELERAGFFPAGGGRVRLTVEGLGARGWKRLRGFELLERGDAAPSVTGCVHLAHLEPSIAERERAKLCRSLRIPPAAIELREHPKSPGPGNAVVVTARSPRVTEVFASFGSRGVGAERVASGAAKAAREYLAGTAPVGPHLADQLLLPLALGAGGHFRAQKATQHFRTNVAVIGSFLGACVAYGTDDQGALEVRVAGRKPA